MAEQMGAAVSTIAERGATLAARQDAVADADRALSDAVNAAHAATTAGIARLDAIGAEIEAAVARRAALAEATPVDGREFQRFLVAKQREIAAVVLEVRDADTRQRAVLDGLRAGYAGANPLVH